MAVSARLATECVPRVSQACPGGDTLCWCPAEVYMLACGCESPGSELGGGGFRTLSPGPRRPALPSGAPTTYTRSFAFEFLRFSEFD